MTDDNKRLRFVRLANDADQFFGSGIVDAIIGHYSGRSGKSGGDQRPRFLRSCRRGDQSKIGDEAVLRHMGPDRGRIGAAAFHELAGAIPFAGPGALGLGVAEQHQTAHRPNVAFPA